MLSSASQVLGWLWGCSPTWSQARPCRLGMASGAVVGQVGFSTSQPTSVLLSGLCWCGGSGVPSSPESAQPLFWPPPWSGTYFIGSSDIHSWGKVKWRPTDHMSKYFKVLSPTNKLLIKICFILQPWEVYLQNDKTEKARKVMIFIWLEVCKILKATELNYFWGYQGFCWWTSDVWMNNKDIYNNIYDS